MTDPSRIVFGISPPPHARAPIARALTNKSQPNQGISIQPASPSLFRSPAAAAAVHDSMTPLAAWWWLARGS